MAGEDPVAEAGREALDLLIHFRPDTALVDITMPGMDGFEVARAIRDLPWGGDVRLIAITGWATAAQRDAILKSGFDDHVAKPATLAELRNVLQIAGD